MNGVNENFSRCAVCSAPAAQVCGGCRAEHYCGKIHQKQAWRSGHRFKCCSFRVEVNDVLGRHLVATRDIKQGEMIFKEKPAVLGPKIVSSPACLSCYKRLMPVKQQQSGKVDFYKCTSCGWPMCDAACQSAKVHIEECELMARRKYTSTITYTGEDKKESAYCVITPLRCLLLKKSDPKQYEAITNMQGHLEYRMNTPLYKILKANIVTFIQQVLGLTEFNEETIMNITAILDNNSFDYRNKNQIKFRGVYLTAAMQSHDCVPNTKHIFMEEYNMAVIATLDIAKGSVISTSYTQPLRGTLARRIHLQNVKCFSCTCARCADRTELGTYLGAIYCSKCFLNNRNKDPENVPKLLSTNPMENNAEWKCNACEHKVQAKQMLWGNEAIAKEVRTLNQTNPKDFEEFIIKYEQALHPKNFHIFEVKYALTQMYGYLPGFTYNELNNAALDRKISLCEEIMEVLDVLQPGYTRSRGELLLELQGAMSVKTKRDLATDKITKEAAQGLMEECMVMLKEATNILKSEPDMHETLQERLQALTIELDE